MLTPEMTAVIGMATVAQRLILLGYPEMLSVRVAMTPPLLVTAPSDDPHARPGREIAESIERATPIVVRSLLHETLAVRCPRLAVQP